MTGLQGEAHTAGYWPPAASRASSTRLAGSAVRHIAITVAALLGIGFFHHVVPHSAHLWHNVFQWLYYLPVVYAATNFGLRGGLGAAAAAAFGYLPHFADAAASPDQLVVQYAEVTVLFLVSAVTGVLADRERKRARELRKTTEELNRVNRELQESFEHVKRADRLAAVGQLSAALAHEIRNPLASIRGAVHVLGDPKTSDDLRQEFRGILKKECSRIESLLTDLLDFARPRLPEYVEVDIANKMDSVIALVAHTAARSGVTLRKDVAAGTPALECDPIQLKQVVLNLTLNAIQAMPEGGEVLLSARQQGSNMLIQVKDEGCGIRPEHLDKIFDPFFTTKDKGTGLGLSVAHQIVTQHGGSIRVEPNARKGVTFSVLVPLDHRRRFGARTDSGGR